MGKGIRAGKKKPDTNKLVTVIVGNKAYQCSKKMALSIVDLAKQKYEKLNISAIVAVEKHDVFTLCREEFSSNDELNKEVCKWEEANFKCYHFESKKEK